MMEDSEDVVVRPKSKPKGPALYKNVTERNVFTEAGRCMPGKTITLTTAQAKAFNGQLEKC